MSHTAVWVSNNVGRLHFRQTTLKCDYPGDIIRLSFKAAAVRRMYLGQTDHALDVPECRAARDLDSEVVDHSENSFDQVTRDLKAPGETTRLVGMLTHEIGVPCAQY